MISLGLLQDFILGPLLHILYMDNLSQVFSSLAAMQVILRHASMTQLQRFLLSGENASDIGGTLCLDIVQPFPTEPRGNLVHMAW